MAPGNDFSSSEELNQAKNFLAGKTGPSPDSSPKKGGKKGGSLFSKKKSSPKKIPQMPDVEEKLTSLSAQLRVLESRYSNLSKRNDLLEENMLRNFNRLREDLKLVSSDLNSLKQKLFDFKHSLTKITKELGVMARREEFDTLKKYVELWEPVNFVTQKEVKEMIEEALEEAK